MENKQPLFLIIALIVFGVALASGIWVFSRKNVAAHRDELVIEITHIAADAFQYRHRPKSIGGGGNSYAGYRIPLKLRENDRAQFSATDSAGAKLSIVASSTDGLGSVSAMVGQSLLRSPR